MKNLETLFKNSKLESDEMKVIEGAKGSTVYETATIDGINCQDTDVHFEGRGGTTIRWEAEQEGFI